MADFLSQNFNIFSTIFYYKRTNFFTMFCYKRIRQFVKCSKFCFMWMDLFDSLDFIFYFILFYYPPTFRILDKCVSTNSRFITIRWYVLEIFRIRTYVRLMEGTSFKARVKFAIIIFFLNWRPSELNVRAILVPFTTRI